MRIGHRAKEPCATETKVIIVCTRPEARQQTRTRKTGKRTTIETHKGDARYVRRSKTGQFKKEVNGGHSLSADRRRKAKDKGKSQLDRGDTGGIIGVVKRAFGKR